MAQNVFDATLDVNNQIQVNTFDWSHANNLTTQIGRVTPIFCALVDFIVKNRIFSGYK